MKTKTPTPLGVGFPSERRMTLLLAAFLHQPEVLGKEQSSHSGVVTPRLRVATPDDQVAFTVFDIHMEVEASEFHDAATESI